jgi:hypothetical protein
MTDFGFGGKPRETDVFPHSHHAPYTRGLKRIDESGETK